MIQSTKNDQYWSFWCQWWPNHQDQEVFWGNMAVEAVEASEVAEATEVNEAAEVCKAWKITTESSRFLKSIIWGLILLILVFWKNFFLTESWKPMLNFSTFSVGGCWGQPMLLFLKSGWWSSKYLISEYQNHLHSNSSLHIFICQSQLKKHV